LGWPETAATIAWIFFVASPLKAAFRAPVFAARFSALIAPTFIEIAARTIVV
jgi:hypothetical protein